MFHAQERCQLKAISQESYSVFRRLANAELDGK